MTIHRPTTFVTLAGIAGALGACQLVAGLGNFHDAGGAGGGGASTSSSGGSGASSSSGKGSTSSGKGGATSSASASGASSSAGVGGATSSTGGSGGCGSQSDPLNCGTCGTNCRGGDCMKGVCTTWEILDGADVSESNITGFALAKDGSGVATGIFWVFGGNATTDGSVMFVSLANPLALETVLGDQCGPVAIASNATDVYWLNSGTCAIPPDGGGNGQVGHAAINGTGPKIVDFYQQAPTVVVASAGGYGWLTAGDANVNLVPAGTAMPVSYTQTVGPVAFAADATSVYWTDIDGGINQMDWDGGHFMTLSPIADQNPSSIAPPVGAVGPYWTDTAGGAVYYYDGKQTVSLPAGSPQGITSDSSGVYWADPSSGDIFKMLPDGGSVTAIASNQPAPVMVLTDEVSVFWLNKVSNTSYTIVRLAK